MNVFVLQYESYSTTEILGVFSTEELAVTFRDKEIQGWGNPERSSSWNYTIQSVEFDEVHE